MDPARALSSLRRLCRLHPALAAAGVCAAVLATAGLAWGGSSLSAVSRPFEHGRHETVSCRECHGAGERHRVTLVRDAGDCAACHHDPARRLACARCHEAGGPAQVVDVRVSLALGVWDAPRQRELPFAHREHTAAIGCTECHGPAVTPTTRACTACHDSHHTAEAECATCHGAPDPASHPPEVHLSCAGSGCHADDRSPARSRSLCVMCHADRRMHEPESDCAGCHRIPALPRTAPVTHSAAARDGGAP
jgi:hypothetical protein